MRSKADAGRGPGLHSLRPALAWQDGFAAGNGWHGALAWGEPRDEQAVVTHHALVLPNSGTGRLPPRLAGQLPALRALLLACPGSGWSKDPARGRSAGWRCGTGCPHTGSTATARWPSGPGRRPARRSRTPMITGTSAISTRSGRLRLTAGTTTYAEMEVLA